MDLGTDLAAMLAMAPGSVTVTIGSDSTDGVEDVSRYDLLDSVGNGLEKVREVLVRAGVLAGLAKEATVVVNGTSYIVRDYRTEDDGRVTRIICVP